MNPFLSMEVIIHQVKTYEIYKNFWQNNVDVVYKISNAFYKI